ncbi:uncharacterized protein LOC126894794 [Daktulosphaira vitifoliae]|uniref:uncharacterized protein LOC126894794 n=1 Tax=Daktulosphaira vitifoliae TaxID=58002 RepID=UPI0021AA9B59|nr:uncharacterized protein LOC126894794 [Daktulosphaira vitifoliae]XP_050522016.1 uncharacterized protein LOC126894794 [Daktulosphaira vitifoliae]
MARQFSLIVIFGILTMSIFSPQTTVGARYLPTRGNEDRLTRLKEMLTDLLESGAQPNYELERVYADHREPVGDYSRLSIPREYNVPDKALLELFNPVVPRHQRPRS